MLDPDGAVKSLVTWAWARQKLHQFIERLLAFMGRRIIKGLNVAGPGHDANYRRQVSGDREHKQQQMSQVIQTLS